MHIRVLFLAIYCRMQDTDLKYAICYACYSNRITHGYTGEFFTD